MSLGMWADRRRRHAKSDLFQRISTRERRQQRKFVTTKNSCRGYQGMPYPRYADVMYFCATLRARDFAASDGRLIRPCTVYHTCTQQCIALHMGGNTKQAKPKVCHRIAVHNAWLTTNTLQLFQGQSVPEVAKHLENPIAVCYAVGEQTEDILYKETETDR